MAGARRASRGRNGCRRSRRGRSGPAVRRRAEANHSPCQSTLRRRSIRVEGSSRHAEHPSRRPPRRVSPGTAETRRLLEADVAQRHHRRRNAPGEVPGEVTGLNREPVRARRQLAAARSAADPLEHAARSLRPADDAQAAVDDAATRARARSPGSARARCRRGRHRRGRWRAALTDATTGGGHVDADGFGSTIVRSARPSSTFGR